MAYSIVSCTRLMRRSDDDLKKSKAKKLGKVGPKVLIRLIAFVEKTPVLPQEEKDAIIDGLADWAQFAPLRCQSQGHA